MREATPRVVFFSGNSPYGELKTAAGRPGGAELSLRWLAERMTDYADVRYCSLGRARIPSRDDRSLAQVRVSHALLPRPWRLWRRWLPSSEAIAARLLENVSADGPPDIVVGYLASPDAQILAAFADSCGAELVLKVGGRAWVSDWGREYPSGFSLADAVTRCRLVLVENDFALGETRRLIGELGGDPEAYQYLTGPFGLPAETDVPGPDQAEPRPEDLPDDFVLFPAHFKAGSKRQDLLLRALATQEVRAAGMHAVFAGDGRLLEDARRLATELDVVERVRFLGPRPPADVARLARSAQAVCLLTDYEFSPKAAVTALRQGAPLVASDLPSLRSLLLTREAREAFLVPNEIERIAARLVALRGSAARETLSGLAFREYAAYSAEVERHASRIRRAMLDLAGESEKRVGQW